VANLKSLYRNLYFALCAIGRPIGGIKPGRIYRYFASRGFDFREPRFVFTTSDGIQLKLNPAFHLDDYIYSFGSSDTMIAKTIRKFVHPNDVCLDVGANMGEFSLLMAKMSGAGGAVLAFEPAPIVHKQLTDHIALNGVSDRIQAFRIALSNTNGEAEFSFGDESTLNQGLGSLVSGKNELVNRTEMIQTQTLTDFAKERDLKKIDFIKVDIQGGEPLFLQGARDAILRYRPTILMEISPADLACLKWTPLMLFEFFDSIGYCLSLISDTERELVRSDFETLTRGTDVLCRAKSK
jgi:FkbM family methyltransferase